MLAAQNAGSLLMLFTGLYADRVNGKWMVGAALALCFLGNVMLPLLAAESFWYAVLARIAIGASDACMSPAVNSLITRWFPQAERAAAIGIITGGRQIGKSVLALATLGLSQSLGFCSIEEYRDGAPKFRPNLRYWQRHWTYSAKSRRTTFQY